MIPRCSRVYWAGKYSTVALISPCMLNHTCQEYRYLHSSAAANHLNPTGGIHKPCQCGCTESPQRTGFRVSMRNTQRNCWQGRAGQGIGQGIGHTLGSASMARERASRRGSSMISLYDRGGSCPSPPYRSYGSNTNPACHRFFTEESSLRPHYVRRNYTLCKFSNDSLHALKQIHTAPHIGHPRNSSKVRYGTSTKTHTIQIYVGVITLSQTCPSPGAHTRFAIIKMMILFCMLHDRSNVSNVSSSR